MENIYIHKISIKKQYMFLTWWFLQKLKSLYPVGFARLKENPNNLGGWHPFHTFVYNDIPPLVSKYHLLEYMRLIDALFILGRQERVKEGDRHTIFIIDVIKFYETFAWCENDFRQRLITLKMIEAPKEKTTTEQKQHKDETTIVK